MKLTFCPVDLPEGQDILTHDYENFGLLKTSVNQMLTTEWLKSPDLITVIWEELTDSEGISRGDRFYIGHATRFHLMNILDSIQESHSDFYFEKDKDAKLNEVKGEIIETKDIHVAIFCFATFEEAFDYAKDYCHGVWAGVADA
jgi:hypothetical protein